MKIKKAVIPAAGLGTRFLPATKAQPKEMLPIVDKPTLQYIVEEAVASGVEEILLITRWGKTSIENHFDRSYEVEYELERKGDVERLDIVRRISDMAEIQYVRQHEAKGLGHAVYCARSFVGNDPFAVLLGDDIVYNPQRPCIGQMVDVFDKYDGTVLGCQTVSEDRVSRYGIIDGTEVESGVYKVNDMVEKPKLEDAPSNIAVLGRYILTASIMDVLRDQKPGHGGEIQLTDAIKTLAKEESAYGYIFEGRRYDVGSKHGYIEAQIDYALRDGEIRDGIYDYMAAIVGGNNPEFKR